MTKKPWIGFCYESPRLFAAWIGAGQLNVSKVRPRTNAALAGAALARDASGINVPECELRPFSPPLAVLAKVNHCSLMG